MTFIDSYFMLTSDIIEFQTNLENTITLISRKKSRGTIIFPSNITNSNIHPNWYG